MLSVVVNLLVVSQLDQPIPACSVPVCVGDANPKTFNYSLTFNGPAAGTCANFTNTSTFTTNDIGATGSAIASVRVCSFKAALTSGYWKNHLAPTGTTGCTGFPSGTYNVNTILKAAQGWATMNSSNSGANSTQNQNAMGCLPGHQLAAKMNSSLSRLLLQII